MPKHRTLRQIRIILTLARQRDCSWPEAAAHARILKENGEPDPGLAYQISVYHKDPVSPRVRERLGLRPICPTCHQPIIAHRRPAPRRRPMTAREKWQRAQARADDLKRRIRHR